MSKPPTEPRDWSSASEALFHGARADHAPNAADRARVRSGLAQRLADASSAPLAGGGSRLEASSKTAVALSTLAKIGLAVVIVAAGALAFLRTSDWSKRAEPKPAVAAGAGNAPSVPVPTAGGTSVERLASPVTPVQSAPPTPAAGRTHARAPAAASIAMRPRLGSGPKAVRTPNPLEPRAEPANSTLGVTAASRTDATTATASTATDPQQTTAARAQPAHTDDGTASRTPLKTEDDSAHPSSTRTESGSTPRDSSERVATRSELDPSDPRAELVFARRMQAAMLAGNPAAVLALCAEHERLWPHGTFVQEREGLRAMAACETDAGDATARANRFLATYPRSTLAPRVRQACAERIK